MKVYIGIPWRPTPERIDVYDYVRSWWMNVTSSGLCVPWDTPHEIFNLNACRNEIVRAAKRHLADVVVIVDADVVVSRSFTVGEAIGSAANIGGIHMPFTQQRYCTAEETKAIINGHPAVSSLEGVGIGNGCCYICRPDQWWQMGGGDERFIGWGGDDDQIVAAATTYVGLHRHRAVAYSLHHADEARPIGSPAQQRNARLAKCYWDAVGKPSMMRQLIDTRPAGWESEGGYEPRYA